MYTIPDLGIQLNALFRGFERSKLIKHEIIKWKVSINLEANIKLITLDFIEKTLFGDKKKKKIIQMVAICMCSQRIHVIFLGEHIV